MKRINQTLKIFIGILVLLAIFSCEKWLNVEPKTKIKSEQVFQKPEYFEQALIGVYLKLSGKALYGQELSFYFMDAAAGMYDIETTVAKYYFADKRDYLKTNNVNIINNIWSNSYNAIANINNILENLETQTILDEVTADLIEAEARGLRAFIHLDLLRMFGPGNLANNTAGLNELTIPYVTKYEKFLSPQLTTSEVLEKIHEDLDKAIVLLKQSDPWYKELPDDYDASDFVTKNRKLRFNYWAALGIKARAYMWEGDYNNALINAETLISGLDTDFIHDNESIEDLDFIRESDDIITDNDIVFLREFIFGFHVHDLYEESNILRFFEAKDIVGSQTDDLMILKTDRFNSIFETDGTGLSDLRRHMFIDYDEDKAFYKYHQEGNFPLPSNNKIAVIRLPEIFYIAAECLNKLGIRSDDALTYLNRVRVSRTLTTDITASDNFAKELEKEYFKDLFGEGQVFYYLKRLGYTELPFGGDVLTSDSFLLPIPQGELNFGRE